ncbi:MAG: ATP-dependent helicase [bacterium]|nr:ATP-dependent helicase [bacterium]
MNKVNKAQAEAISHNKGPMLVLAGPGSGKTFVITTRTKTLIEEHHVNPNNILVITFTKAAAVEMQERFERLMGQKRVGVHFGTFHAIFFQILKYAYGFNASNIIREDQRAQFFKETIRKMDLEIEDEADFISGIQSEVSLVKGDMLSLEHYYSINCSEEIFKKIYHAYDDYLRRHNLIDFDDMLVFTYELFKERKDILAIWQKRYQYILIDEFQDINTLQYKIVQMLAKPEDNLFIVGDDDQSIYRFRGAKPEIMLNFKNEYPEAKQVLLDINYRSTEKIVKSASRLIKNNKKRFDKKISTIHGEGENIVLKEFATLPEENKEILSQIAAYHKAGYEYSDMAILFRTNIQPRSLIEKLLEYNLPFKMKDSIPNIYEHWIARNIIDYIKFACGSRDRNTFLQIMNRPNRYFSRDAVPNTMVDFTQLRSFYSDRTWMFDRINKLEYDLDMIKGMDPYSAVYYIRKAIGYEEYLTEYATFRRIKVEELLDTLNEIAEAAKPFKTFEEWFHHMEEYKEELQNQVKDRYKNNNDGISLATMHSSKGLEYEIVFIIDANEEITPHHKAILDEDLEEERRMFYVGMTRAKSRLHIYWVKERYNKELVVSRFVRELYLSEYDLQVGTVVEHKNYGTGTILVKENGKLTVDFPKFPKPKILDIKYCLGNQLLKIGE